MSNEAVNAGGNDPLKTVADALDAAVEAAREGAKDAKTAASDAIPAINSFLTGITYKTCYAVAYGIVFPTMLAVRSIPKENALVHGFVDGARAATDVVEEMKAKSLGDGHANPSSP